MLQLVVPSLGLLRECFFIRGMERPRQIRHMLAGVIEVEDTFRQRKVAVHELFQAVAPVGQRDLLFGLVPTDLRGLPTQLQAEFVQLVKAR
ncbi:MAG: hypothetical protein K2Y37_21570 [Pirellulales bacterium]|nr:hypothetical protein [Pirellulales bacterium]